MTRTMESFARVARWPYAGLPPKSTNSLIRSSMSARDPQGLPTGPTGSRRRRLVAIAFPPPECVRTAGIWTSGALGDRVKLGAQGRGFGRADPLEYLQW